VTSRAVADAGIKAKAGVASVTAYAGAAALLVAATWYALVVAEVVVPAEPRLQPGQSREEWLQTYFSWFASTLADERFYGGAAIIGFLCLLATAAFLRDELEPERALTKLGAQAVAAGAIIWVVGNCVLIVRLGAMTSTRPRATRNGRMLMSPVLPQPTGICSTARWPAPAKYSRAASWPWI
jgi:hypothetical protein